MPTTDPFQQIRDSLDESLFVEAGAGTGKTKALVDRLVALVVSGIAIEQIVAITFTEKAAAELRERVRGELERAAQSGDPAGHVRAALDALDAAPISTIHAFAAGLVRSFAAEAGVDPDFAVVDEIAAERRFQQRWRERLEQLGEDPRACEVFSRGLRLGLLPANLEKLARDLWQRPDLATQALAMPPLAAPAWPDFGALRSELSGIPIGDKPVDDQLAVRLRRLCGLVDLLVEASDVQREALLAGGGVESLKFGVSRVKVWGPNKASFVATAEQTRDTLVGLLARLRETALRSLVPYVARFVLDDRTARCQDGDLTFDDLITITSDLVAPDGDVRKRFRPRYHAMLIDEFQDTDPWQFDIARAFATDPDTGIQEPGRLFLVGDPKQSIYRFRNADMGIYNAARVELAAAGESVALVENRRSVQPIIDWVNTIFSGMFADESQPAVSPAYRAMTTVRDDALAGLPLAVIGGVQPRDLLAPAVRRIEAAHLASVCQRVVDGQWEVLDRADSRVRPAQYRDIAILMPARTGLPDIERSLERAGIPFRVESGSLVFQTQEVRDLINILAAIDDSADQVAIVAALRSPGLACSDVDLVRHKLAGGSFNYLRPENPAGPVTDALARLRRLHDLRPSWSLATLAHEVLSETGIIASAILDTRDRDSFRRGRFIVDQARAFEADGPQPLRAFVAWLEERSSRPLVDHEGAALDQDEDAVRVLTVHGAKGLEFPIIIMAGFGTDPRSPGVPTFAVDPASGELAVCVGAKSRGNQCTAGPVAAIDENEKKHAAAEQIRLLYVAATRARDHLVLSLYHSARSTRSGAAKLLAAGAAEGIPVLEPGESGQSTASPLANIAVDLPEISRDQAAYEREALISASTRLIVTSATALGGEKAEAQGEDTEPWSRGRGSTRLGRAVHAVLQSVPIDAQQDLIAAFAHAQAVAEAIPSREADVIRLAQRALQSPVAARARSARRALREVPFAFTTGTATGNGGGPSADVIVEGFVDLLIEDANGIEIVDWKTDDITGAEVVRRMREYELQAGLYVLGLERVIGQPIKRVTYMFLSPDVEHDFGDIGYLKSVALTRLAELTADQPIAS
jgi:ATP-dependent exoDNAse (exonuclease V) beta subunit